MRWWWLVLCGGCHLAFPRLEPDPDAGEPDPLAGCTDPDLLGCFQFEGNLDDGTGRNGTMASGEAFVAGVDGQAVRTVATTRIDINSPAQLSSQGELTIETWIRPAGGNRLQDELVIDFDECWGLELAITGQVKCYAAGGQAVTTSASLKDAVWQHLACTQVDDQVAIYIDGVERARGTLTLKLDGCSDAAIAGNAPSQQLPPEPLRATLDRLRIWNRVLTADELAKEVARFAP